MKKFAVVEKKFDYKGHECVVVFNCWGFRCGYVSVKEDKDYDKWNIDCHGGLTFNGELPYEYGQKEKYFIGFDCGHLYDYQNKEQAFEYGLISETEYYYYKNSNLDLGGVERDLEYVESQCRKIVDQLEEKETNND